MEGRMAAEGRKRWRRGVCQSPRARLLQLESIFALGISITGLQSSASLIMDGHMALLTHTALRLPPPPPPVLPLHPLLLLLPHHGPLICPQLLPNLFQKFCLLYIFLFNTFFFLPFFPARHILFLYYVRAPALPVSHESLEMTHHAEL